MVRYFLCPNLVKTQPDEPLMQDGSAHELLAYFDQCTKVQHKPSEFCESPDAFLGQFVGSTANKIPIHFLTLQDDSIHFCLNFHLICSTTKRELRELFPTISTFLPQSEKLFSPPYDSLAFGRVLASLIFIIMA